MTPVNATLDAYETAGDALALQRDSGQSADVAVAGLRRMRELGLLADTAQVLEVLRAFPQNTAVQELGLAALVTTFKVTSLGADTDTHSVQAVEGGAVRLVALALCAHSTVAGVVEQAAAALHGIFVLWGDSAARDRMQHAFDPGCSELLVVALRANLANGPAVCSDICGALLCALCGGTDAGATAAHRQHAFTAAHRQRAFRTGAIDTAVSALRACLAHPEAPASAITRCIDVVNFVMVDAGTESRVAAVEAGAIDLVVEAMMSSQSKDMQYSGVSFLSSSASTRTVWLARTRGAPSTLACSKPSSGLWHRGISTQRLNAPRCAFCMLPWSYALPAPLGACSKPGSLRRSSG